MNPILELVSVWGLVLGWNLIFDICMAPMWSISIEMRSGRGIGIDVHACPLAT